MARILGHGIGLSAISEYLLAGYNKGIWTELLNSIQCLGTGWCLIAKSSDCVVAEVDSVRSYPIFYALIANQLKVSNSARQRQGMLSNKSFDLVAVTEFLMSGYVTRAKTLSKEIRQPQVGELLVAKGPDWNPAVIRYLQR